MPGLIANAIPRNDQFLSYEPERAEINPETDTVQGRLGNLLQTDSPFLTQARTRATQASNRRGLINSSIAASAGEAAAYDAAIPVAAEDARIYNARNMANQTAANQALQFGATAGNRFPEIEANRVAQEKLLVKKGEIDLQLQTAEGAIRSRLLAEQGDIDRQLVTLRAQSDRALQELRGSQELAQIQAQGGVQTGLANLQNQGAMARTQTQLAGDYSRQLLSGAQNERITQINNEHQTTLQNSASAQNIMSQAQTAAVQIGMRSDITANDKQALIQNVIDMADAQLSVVGATLGIRQTLQSLLTFATSGPATTPPPAPGTTPLTPTPEAPSPVAPQRSTIPVGSTFQVGSFPAGRAVPHPTQPGMFTDAAYPGDMYQGVYDANGVLTAYTKAN